MQYAQGSLNPQLPKFAYHLFHFVTYNPMTTADRPQNPEVMHISQVFSANGRSVKTYRDAAKDWQSRAISALF